MYSNLSQYIGILGNILLVIATLPQIKKTIITKKSEDISAFMWFVILAGDTLMLIHAILINDTIFAVLFTTVGIQTLVMLYLTFKYKEKKEIISPRKVMEEEKNQEQNKKEEAPAETETTEKLEIAEDKNDSKDIEKL